MSRSFSPDSLPPADGCSLLLLPLQETVLLEQPTLVDPSKTIADSIKEAIAAIGEKISVRRFIKYSLGEGLEKKSNDFAAEVAAVTGAK